MALSRLQLTALPGSVRAALTTGESAPITAATLDDDGRGGRIQATQAGLELTGGQGEELARLEVPTWTPQGWGERDPQPEGQTRELTLRLGQRWGGRQLRGELVSEKGSVRKGRLWYWSLSDGTDSWFWFLRGKSSEGVTLLRRGAPDAEPVLTLGAGKPLRKVGEQREVQLLGDGAQDDDVVVAAMLCAGGFDRELVSRNEQIGKFVKWVADGVFWGEQEAGPASST